MKNLKKALDLIKEFRVVDTGCAWTRSQTWKSLIPHTQEEIYELIEAIENNNVEGVRDELGDLLYHLIFYAEIAEENGLFDLESISETILHKHERRMPTAEERVNFSAEEIDSYWEKLKTEERKQKQQHSIFDGITTTLPAMLKALKLQNRAARVGFDWPSYQGVLTKIQEEIQEIEHALEEKQSQERIEDEIGDLLFAVINLARKCDVHPEQALRQCNRKFIRRFSSIENALAEQDRTPQEASLEEMEELWEAAKENE